MRLTIFSCATVYLFFICIFFKWHTTHSFLFSKYLRFNGGTCAPTPVCFNTVLYTIIYLCSLSFVSSTNKECRDCPLYSETSASNMTVLKVNSLRLMFSKSGHCTTSTSHVLLYRGIEGLCSDIPFNSLHTMGWLPIDFESVCWGMLKQHS